VLEDAGVTVSDGTSIDVDVGLNVAEAVALGAAVAVSVGAGEGEGVAVDSISEIVAVTEGSAVGVREAGVEVAVGVSVGSDVAEGGSSVDGGGSSVGGASVVGDGTGVRVGTVCRSAGCPGLAHVTGSALSATVTASIKPIQPRRCRRSKALLSRRAPTHP